MKNRLASDTTSNSATVHASGSGLHSRLRLTEICVALTSMLLFLPYPPVMPGSDLDASFTLGINTAVAQRMAFGHEVIFTAGPLGSVWSRTYHPRTILIVLIAGGLLGIGHTVATNILSRNTRHSWVWIYMGYLLFLLESRDALFLTYPMLLSLLIYRLSLPLTHRDHIRLRDRTALWFMLAIASLGLLPIIKLSFLPLPLAISLIGAIQLWTASRMLAVSLIVLPIVSTVMFWVATGQALSTLPTYFSTSASLITGYAPAMMSNWYVATPALFAATSLLVLFYFYRTRPSVSVHEHAFVLLAAAFLFVSFKSGFTRHDVHALTAGASIVMAAMCVSGLRSVNRAGLAGVFLATLITWTGIHWQNENPGYEYYKSPGRQLASELKAWFTGRQPLLSLRHRYDSGLADIRRKKGVPNLSGTVDIYPVDVAVLVASGNRWSPRPVFQSYAAYTPDLAMLNSNHLSGSTAPDNILFDVATIDDRYPALDDGASWPLLLARYQLQRVYGNYLLLVKRAGQSAEPVLTPVLTKRGHLGEPLVINMPGYIVFAQISVTPSFPGRIANFLLKSTELKISVKQSNGVDHRHRFVPGEGASGFVLSPYVSDKGDFATLMDGVERIDASTFVDTLTIDEAPREWGLWNREYAITLFTLTVERRIARSSSR